MATHSRGQNVKRVEVVWPGEFVDQIDKARGSVSRSRFIRLAVGEKLPGGRLDLKTPEAQPEKTHERIARKALAQAPKSARERLAERTALLREGKKVQADHG